MTWLIEQGIGEERAIELRSGTVVAAQVSWPGRLAAGQVEDATLISRPKASSRGRARFASGEEALVDRLPRDVCEGAPLRLIVTRGRIGESGRIKPAWARPTDMEQRPAPSLLENLKAAGREASQVLHFPAGHWEEIWSEAWTGSVDFRGGSLHLTPAPAMTLIDVDGSMPPRELALAAVEPIASAIRRFNLAGSIGVDFPTLQAKADRRAVDEDLAEALRDWPHERTAMNGFGFVQIVSRLERPSLLELVTHDRAGAAARQLLRRAEKISGPGAILLTCHPAVRDRLQPAWIAELCKRTGREVRIAPDPALALESGFAQALSS